MNKRPICHPDYQMYCKGMCRNCYEKRLRETNPSYNKRQQENSKNWHLKNKDRKREYDRVYVMFKPNKAESKFFNYIKNKHGMTKEQYVALVERCDNKCMICNRPPYDGKRLHLDHNHTTGKVRGLLCTRCNWYLATIEKDETILNKIKNYLKNGK